MQSQRENQQLKILNRQLRVMRKRHLRYMMNLWFVSLLAMAWPVSMNLIDKIWGAAYPAGNFCYIAGALMILTGSISLQAYHYIGLSQINFHYTITENALLYLQTLRRKIHKKLILLLTTSTVFYMFFSVGLYFMLFRWMPPKLRNGIMDGYFGFSLVLSPAFCGSLIQRFVRQHRPILKLIHTLV